MANISIADLKMLREQLGTGMSDTKAALEEAGGDVEKATEILRLKGAKGNAKRADRSTSEGLVAVAEGEGAVTMIALGCETDFVAKNEKFISLAERVVGAVAASGAADLESALAAPAESGTVKSIIEEQAATIGEKVELTKVTRVEGEQHAVYLHRTSKDLPPQVGVVVAYSGGDAETARAVAQHIAMFDPTFVSRDEVPAEQVEKERELVSEIARGEGKPEGALPKIIEGRLNGFFKQIVLLDQDYARDSKQTVGKVLEAAGIAVTGFARFKVGA